MDQLISFEDSTYVYVGEPHIIGKKFMDLVYKNITDIDVLDNICRITTPETEVKIDLDQINGLGLQGIDFCFSQSFKEDNRIQLIKKSNKLKDNSINREEVLKFLLFNLDSSVEFLIRVLDIPIEDIQQAVIVTLNKRIKFYSDLTEIVEQFKKEKNSKNSKDLIYDSSDKLSYDSSDKLSYDSSDKLSYDSSDKLSYDSLDELGLEDKTKEMKELDEFLEKNSIILIKDIDLNNNFNLFRKHDKTIQKIVKEYFDRVSKLYVAVKFI